MSNSRPIGIFDSGLGGLSVWRKVRELLPHESIFYFADSGNCPYGPQSHATIQEMCEGVVRYLLDQKCKLIIVACNTATAAAIDSLRTQFPVPFVGMEPAVKPAALQSKTGCIGVLATEGTFKGELYQRTVAAYAKEIKLISQIGYGLVELVEKGQLEGPEVDKLLLPYLQPMLDQNIDQLVLGCTHYPFLAPAMQRLTGPDVKIVDPAPAVAKQVKKVMEDENLVASDDSKTVYQFATSGDKKILESFLHALSIPEPIIAEYEEGPPILS